MAKFQFKLESIERVRKVSEEIALQEFAKSQTAFYAAIREKENLIESRNQALIQRENLAQNISNKNDHAMINNFILGLGARIIRADQAIVRARRFLNQAFRVYANARKSRMMLEKLREKALQEYKMEQARREQKIIDDLISTRINLESWNKIRDEQEDAA